MSMRTFAHGAGYLLNDNRASGQGKEEADILLCPHCQKVIKLAQWKAADGSNGWCSRCKAPCCGSGPCAAKFQKKGCLPFVKRIEHTVAALPPSLRIRPTTTGP